jgi:hypothetical protein
LPLFRGLLYIPRMARENTFARLPGFRDFPPEEMAFRQHIFDAWRRVSRRYGFLEYDGPPLEELSLYTRRAGTRSWPSSTTSQDKGGREVALRPEMTPSLARMLGSGAAPFPSPSGGSPPHSSSGTSGSNGDAPGALPVERGSGGGGGRLRGRRGPGRGPGRTPGAGPGSGEFRPGSRIGACSPRSLHAGGGSRRAGAAYSRWWTRWSGSPGNGAWNGSAEVGLEPEGGGAPGPPPSPGWRGRRRDTAGGTRWLPS